VNQKQDARRKERTALRFFSSLTLIAWGCVFALRPLVLRAQDNPKFVIDEDCQAFDISADDAIVYAVPRLKRVRRLIIERDDISVATGRGKTKQIVDADKFMPFPPPQGYSVDSLAWSPDGRRIAVNMSLQKAPPGYETKEAKKKGNLGEDEEENKPLASITGGRVVALLDDDGHEIKVANSKTRFIEGATHGTWLADDATVVYQTGGGPYGIARVRPADGKLDTLFEGHTFNAIVWDAKRNAAYAIGEGIGIHRGLTLVRLDLLHELVTDIAHVEMYQGALSLSPSGTKIAYFEDGDYIDVIDMTNSSKNVRVRTGYGRFEWGRHERHIALKRGPFERSNILLWVGLYDGTFASLLHGLEFHDFHIAPDGDFIAVTEPGKRALKVYPLP
jgi:hypothetical protein